MQLPQFDKIKVDDFEPAIVEAIAAHDAEVEAIASSDEAPTFGNTILALERSGAELNRVLGIFFPLLGVNATPEMQAVSQRVTPLLSRHSTSITLNERLWQRIRAAAQHLDGLDEQDRRLAENTVEAFERSGATLEGDDRDRFRELVEQLSKLSLQFEQNVLAEMAAYRLWLGKDDLDGLPESIVEAAREAAVEAGRPDQWLITLQAPSFGPFMKYSARRDLRHTLYLAYGSLCSTGDHSNVAILTRIAALRLQLARLMGHDTFADYRLERMMAGSPQAVLDMLGKLRDTYLPAARREVDEIREFAARVEGHPVDVMPWDYSYYYNKLRDERYNVNDEQLRPYFPLEGVIKGVFGLATRLYGLRFTPINDAPVWHPEVRVWRVTDDDGDREVGVLYADFFPRATKQSGAWMTNIREQHVDADGRDIRPYVMLATNFSRPTGDKPSLLTFGEVNTLLHEFGHCLHGLLSQVRHESLSGTNVRRDFVELPSQLNENFLRHREFIDTFAAHYDTGEAVPDALLSGKLAAMRFGAGYNCVRQLSFGYLDMAWHSITREVAPENAAPFERDAMAKVSLFDPVEGCMMSPHFSHIFAGGYAAGYYGYKWAEVLDADAFECFEREGIFNRDTARRWRECVLSRGDTADPMSLYVAFTGHEPRIDALLRRDFGA